MRCWRASCTSRSRKIELAQFEGAAGDPTYRVHALDAAGKELLAREFTVTTVERPYNGVMPEYEKVQVDTGWVRMESGAATVLDERIATDIEEFWEHYHNEDSAQGFQHRDGAFAWRAAS